MAATAARPTSAAPSLTPFDPPILALFLESITNLGTVLVAMVGVVLGIVLGTVRGTVLGTVPGAAPQVPRAVPDRFQGDAATYEGDRGADLANVSIVGPSNVHSGNAHEKGHLP